MDIITHHHPATGVPTQFVFEGRDAVLIDPVLDFLTLPASTRAFPGHDYPVNGRAVRVWAPLGEQRASRVQLRDGITREAFVEVRTRRDAGLSPPAFFLPSLRVNLDAGAR